MARVAEFRAPAPYGSATRRRRPPRLRRQRRTTPSSPSIGFASLPSLDVAYFTKTGRGSIRKRGPSPVLLGYLQPEPCMTPNAEKLALGLGNVLIQYVM